MGLVVAEIEAGEEGCVEQCGGVLADAATDRGREHAIGDDPCIDKPVLSGSSADVVIDRELATGLNHRPLGELGDALDVDVPGLVRLVVGRELADHLDDAERLGPFDAPYTGILAGSEFNDPLACFHPRQDSLRRVEGAADCARGGADNTNAADVVDGEGWLVTGLAIIDEEGLDGRLRELLVKRDRGFVDGPAENKPGAKCRL